MIMKKVTYLLFLLPLIFISCSKNEVDMRDDYVGTWNESSVGSMSLLLNGSIVSTTPLSDSQTGIEITKSGTNQLVIDGLAVTVSGSKLSIESNTQTETQDGITMTVTSKYNGTVSKNMIVVNENYTGSWSMTGMSGTISGSSVYTFTR
jgi:hypothetical protein